MRANLTVLALTLLIVASPAFGADLNVPSGPYPTIQSAIDAAAVGDVVIVAPGVYPENIIYWGKPITVRGSDPNDPATVAATVIDGSSIGPVATFFAGEGRDSVLEGLTLTNGSAAFDGAGIRIMQASPVISKCVIEQNTAANSGGGVYAFGALANPLIEKCIIRFNDAAAQVGGGIACRGGASAEIFNNIIHDCTADAGAGIYLLDSNATILNNVLYSNTAATAGGGVYLENSAGTVIRNNTIADNISNGAGAGGVNALGGDPAISNCILWNNGDDLAGATALFSDIEDGDAGNGNISDDPMFFGGDYHIDPNSPCVDSGDPADDGLGETDMDGEERVLNGRIDMGADEAFLGAGFTLDVIADPETNRTINITDDAGSTTLVTPYAKLYADGVLISLTVPPTDETFFVRWTLDGIPQPLGVRTLQFTVDQPREAAAIFVAGGTWLVAQDGSGDFTTIQAAIDAGADGDVIAVRPGVYHERINMRGKALTVQGLAPEDPDVVAATVIDGDAGGTVVTCVTAEVATTVLRGLTITNGSATYGGGVYCSTDFDNATSPTFEFCDIRDNTAYSGGGVYVTFGSPAFSRCQIRDNHAGYRGGAFYGDNVGGQTPYNPSFESTRILNNFASSNGGAMFLESYCRATLRSSVVAGNICNSVGGIYSQGATTIRYSTIADNSSYGVYRASGNTNISNSIIWGNGDDIGGSSINVTYSDVSEAVGGVGNIQEPPSFADPGAGVYNLQSNSPCIDAGQPGVFLLPGELDLDGEERIFGEAIDMGADETDFTSDAHVLWITSTPASGVEVAFTPIDIHSLGTGETPYFRSFLANPTAPIVTLTAPATSVAGAFRRWVLDDAPQPIGQMDLDVLMNMPHSARAEYLAPLTISSNVPALPVTVSPPDANGDGDGITEFVRYYDLGALVSLEAPPPDPNDPNAFAWIGWQLDGQDMGAAFTLDVTMDGIRQATAVYDRPTHLLTIDATEQAFIQISHEDLNGDLNDTAPPAFQRTYYEGLTVTLTAPAESCVSPFLHWSLNGIAQAPGADIDVLIDGPHAALAVYADSGPDCNGNGVGDLCDIGMGFSDDCNLNDVPDECEPDCNNNGVADECDIKSGLSLDCNANGIPDECDVDCNNNGIPDDCDLVSGASKDCNADGVPDECQLAGNDCNANGIPDGCDLISGASKDCNTDGVPDECQLAGDDCNANGVPDECDLNTGVSADCDGNGVPDDCQTDKDQDGVIDACDNCPDLANQDQADIDADGVGDACQNLLAIPTCNDDILVDADDEFGAVVNFTLPVTAGGIGDVTVTSDPASGSTFPVGTSTVKVTAVDDSGAVVTCTFDVTVAEPDQEEQEEPNVPAEDVINRDAMRVGLSMFFGIPICGCGAFMCLCLTLTALAGFKVSSLRRRK